MPASELELQRRPKGAVFDNNELVEIEAIDDAGDVVSTIQVNQFINLVMTELLTSTLPTYNGVTNIQSGDGGSSTNLTYRTYYDTVGDYTVSGSRNTTLGAKTRHYVDMLEVVAEEAPIVIVGVDDDTPSIGQPITVSLHDSSNWRHNNSNIVIDWGDGSEDYDVTLTSASSHHDTHPTHSYASAGVKTITVTVTTDAGTDSDTVDVTVSAPISNLEAEFTGDDDTTLDGYVSESGHTFETNYTSLVIRGNAAARSAAQISSNTGAEIEVNVGSGNQSWSTSMTKFGGSGDTAFHIYFNLSDLDYATYWGVDFFGSASGITNILVKNATAGNVTDLGTKHIGGGTGNAYGLEWNYGANRTVSIVANGDIVEVWMDSTLCWSHTFTDRLYKDNTYGSILIIGSADTVQTRFNNLYCEVPGGSGDAVTLFTRGGSTANYGRTSGLDRWPVATGDWDDTATWNDATLPVAGDIIGITGGFTVTKTDVDTTKYKYIAVYGTGSKLKASRTDDSMLCFDTILVHDGGHCDYGLSGDVIPNGVSAILEVNDGTLHTEETAGTIRGRGIILCDTGRFTTRGEPVVKTFVRLAAEITAGDDELSIDASTPVDDWQVGQLVMVPDTRHLMHAQTNESYVNQCETRTITDVSVDGLTITVDTPFTYTHRGRRDETGTLDGYPHVGLLSHNVIIRSEDPTGVRGHIVITDNADFACYDTEFYELGRSPISVFTTEEPKGEYPIHFHHHVGPVTPQANGYQGTVERCAIYSLLSNNATRWAVTLHRNHKVLVKDNVCYNYPGGLIVLEDGNETGNRVEGNFCVRSMNRANRVNHTWTRADAGGNLDDLTHEGVGIWFRGFNNEIVGNVCANCSSFGFVGFAAFLGVRTYPTTQGVPPETASTTETLPNTTPLLLFEDNEVYGATAGGMTLWWLNATYQTFRSAGESFVTNFTTWHTHVHGYFGYESDELTFENPHITGDPAVKTAGQSILKGIESSDYAQANFKVIGGTIRNCNIGVSPSTYSGPNGHHYEDIAFKNCNLSVWVGLMWTSAYRCDVIPARTTYVKNCTYDASCTYTVICDNFSPSVIANHIQDDEIFVESHNGVADDDFQLFYTEQHPDYVLPTTVLNGDSTPMVLGTSVAGRTNAIEFAATGNARAGAVAPTTTTRAKVAGYLDESWTPA
jgi:hypothetical protein